jgi:hypothetical protein
LKYIFDDGREIIIGPLHVADQASADQKLIDLEPDVLISAQEADAQLAVDNDSVIDQSGEASNKQVARQYLKIAMSETDLYRAYQKLKKANDFIDVQGWSNAQVKSNLSITDDQWSAIVARYQYLSLNAADIQNYHTLTLNDPGTGDM